MSAGLILSIWTAAEILLLTMTFGIAAVLWQAWSYTFERSRRTSIAGLVVLAVLWAAAVSGAIWMTVQGWQRAQ